MNATFDSEVSFSPERDQFETQRLEELRREFHIMKLVRENIQKRDRQRGVYVYRKPKSVVI